MIKTLKILSSLFKFKISIFIGLSACIGFILAGGTPDASMALVAFGVFLFACGSCGLNEVQEYKEDALMDRTKCRPIPNGEISKIHALIVSLLSIMTGMAIFLVIGSYTSLFISLSAIFWYNLVYTPLKKKTALAVFPGSLVGAAGPAIGWLIAGGLVDMKLMAVCLFFVIWQMPHFLLLMVSHEKEYRKAGFPVITDIFSRDSLKRVIFSWAIAMTASGILIPYTNGYGSKLILLAIFLNALFLIYRMRKNIFSSRALMELNLYFLLTSLLLALDRLIFV